ncbi:MAG: hypothetical protein KDK91_23875, partial [Gammaproteobacteria bacterium]|nr:hypothetical protein [Gammaproteobacteria bacterium]
AIARPEARGAGARVIVPSTRVLGSRNRVRTALIALLDLEPGLEPDDYARALASTAAGIAELSVDQLRSWAAERSEEALRALSDEPASYLSTEVARGQERVPLTRPSLRITRSNLSPRDATEAFYRMLSSARISPAAVQSALDEVLRANASSDFDLGLGLFDNGIGATIEGSRFDAHLVLNAGSVEAEPLRESHLPGDELMEPVVPGMNLRLSGNRLQRVMSMIPREFLDANGRVGKPVPGHRSLFVSDNVFSAADSGFIAATTNMQGDHYDGVQPESLAAAVLGMYATFSNNWSANPARIRTSILLNIRKSAIGNLQLDVD